MGIRALRLVAGDDGLVRGDRRAGQPGRGSGGEVVIADRRDLVPDDTPGIVAN